MAAVALALLPQHGRAADTLRYSVGLAATGEKPLDDAAQAASNLVQLHDGGALSPAALVARARTDAGRLEGALRSLGHYAGTVQITMAGLALDDATLPDTLETWAEGHDVPVQVTITPGPVFKLGHVELHGDSAGLSLDLKPGDPAVAANVLAAGAKLQQALLDSGHALARVDPPVAELDSAAQAVNVSFTVDAGPRVSIGKISIEGNSGLDEDYIRRRLALKSGTVFSPKAIEAARADLAKVPVIASVRLNPGTAVDADGRLPVDVVVSERKQHGVSFTAAYSTDQGGNVTTSWTDRNLFGEAEVLTLSAGITQIAATDAKQPGYKLASLLTFPDWIRREQSLDLTALAIRESLQAYDRTAEIVGTTFSRRIAAHWTASIGVFVEQAHFIQDEVGRDYSLVQTPLGLHYTTVNNTIDATRGSQIDATVTPTESFGRKSATFFIAQVGGAHFFDLAAPGRSVLALRGLIGTVQGAGPFDIPPDQRFYAGGSGTIRGYRYQSVGPELGNGQPAGGASLVAGTIEFRQRFGADWGAAAFIDAGQAAASALPFTGQIRAGAGVGVRYYTSIGPLRADVAIPLIHQDHSDSFELYLGLGQAF